MLKDMAWNVFKKTGNITSFLELKGLEQKKIDDNEMFNINENIGGLFGNNKDKGNSNK